MVSSSKFMSSWSKICAIICLFFLLSCSLKYPEQPQEPIVIEQKEAIEDISANLIFLIVSEYYNYELKPIVHIDVKTKSTDKSVDVVFLSFIHNSLLKKFSEANQISVVKKADVSKDCSLFLDIAKDTLKTIHIKATIYRTDNTILHEKSYSYKNDTFDLDKYEQFKIKYTAFRKKQKDKAERLKKHGNTRLKVSGYPRGKIMDARARQHRCLFTTIYRITDHEFVGIYDSYFPTRLTCRINGEDYEAAVDNTIFDGNIAPGRIEFTAWFLEGFWDPSHCLESLGEKHKKSFFVDIKRNDKIKIEILYIFDDRRATFAIRVLKEITVIKNGQKVKKFKEIKVK